VRDAADDVSSVFGRDNIRMVGLDGSPVISDLSHRNSRTRCRPNSAKRPWRGGRELHYDVGQAHCAADGAELTLMGRQAPAEAPIPTMRVVAGAVSEHWRFAKVTIG